MAFLLTTRTWAHLQPTPWTRPVDSPRLIRGIVLHHTATSGLPAVRYGASWHYVIDRDGTVYRDVPEDYIAHHCGATDRWRPAWVERGPGTTSDINWCSLGVELVYAPQSGELPTAAQLAACGTLVSDIYRRWGALPVVGHGDVDRSKWPTEPHGLDWTAAGFGRTEDDDGWWWIGLPTPPVTPDEQEEGMTRTDAEQALLELHAAIGITREGVELLISRNGRGAEIGAELVERGGTLAGSRLASGQRRSHGRAITALGAELAAWTDG